MTKIDSDIPITPSGSGWKRPGPGYPKGRPQNKTVKRLEMLKGLVEDQVAAEAFGNLSPLDVMTIAVWKLLEAKRFVDAAEIAARMAPYRHARLGVIMKAEDNSAILQQMMEDDDPPLIDVGKKED